LTADFPVLGAFFNLWPTIEPISRHTNIRLRHYDGHMAVDTPGPDLATSLQLTKARKRRHLMVHPRGHSSSTRPCRIWVVRVIVVMIQSIFHRYTPKSNRQLGNGNKTRCIWIGEFANNNIMPRVPRIQKSSLPTSSNLRAWSFGKHY
jgi:sorbitol/mannitol transport system permease protein